MRTAGDQGHALLRRQIENLVGSMVHGSVEPGTLAWSRHHAFIGSHLAGGLLALLAGPLALIALGGADWFHVGAIAWLSVPLFIAAFLSRTGKLSAAYCLSTLSLAVLATYVALFTGGLSSFALPWLVAVPAEAALSGRRSIVTGALVAALVALLGVASADLAGALPPSRVAGGELAGFVAFGTVVAVIYVGGIALGVHAHHVRAEAAVRESELRHRVLAENATDLITRHNSDGEVVFATGAAEAIAGCASGELAGNGLFERILDDDRPAYLLALSSALEEMKPAAVQFRLRSHGDANTRDVWVEMRCKPVAPAEGGETGMAIVAVTRDISALKAQQDELREARESAESANRAKTFFLANVSHELRTPLNAIIGFSEILKEDVHGEGGDSRGREYAGLIRDSGAHLLQLVNELLDLSKIEAGKFELSIERFDLADVVGECLKLMQPVAREAEVTLASDVPAAGLDLVADRRALKQIAINLISNAVKFSNRGDTVRIEAEQVDQNAELRIIDEGCGIAEAILPRIGTPFTQGDVAYSRHHQGTGLGLSVVKGLVELHGGALEIESEVDVGTSIRVRLPLVAAQQAADDTALAEAG